MVRFKGIRKDSLKTRAIEDNLLGIERVPKSAYPQFGDKKSCSRCGKLHDGKNCDGVKICFTCKQPGHFARDCRSSKGLGSSSSSQVAKGNDNGKKVQGRMYALTTQDAQATDTMVASILHLFYTHAKVLFDLGFYTFFCFLCIC